MNSFFGLTDWHVHVEGALPRDFVRECYARRGRDPEDFDRLLHFDSFRGFLQGWWQTMGLLLAQPDFEEMAVSCAQAFGRRLEEQKIIRCEAHISPIDATYIAFDGFEESAVSRYQDLILAWDEGFASIQKEGHEIRYLVDLVRNYPGPIADLQWKALQEILPRLRYIAGVGVGGGHKARRLNELGPILESARSEGLKTVVHAGELPPQELALQELEDALSVKAHRVGHGIHALMHETFRKQAIQKGLFFEICPGSNLATGSIESRDQLPLDDWAEEGLRFGIFADDPLWFGTEIQDEITLSLQNVKRPEVLRNHLVLQGLIALDGEQ